jgi:hypothetical protein
MSTAGANRAFRTVRTLLRGARRALSGSPRLIEWHGGSGTPETVRKVNGLQLLPRASALEDCEKLLSAGDVRATQLVEHMVQRRRIEFRIWRKSDGIEGWCSNRIYTLRVKSLP